MGWEASNGQSVAVEATGLYIDGEFLVDQVTDVVGEANTETAGAIE